MRKDLFYRLSSPLDVTLGVTSLCNFSCRHCIAGNTLNGRSDLTKEELFKIIDDLAAAKVFNICVFGGEPFCRDDIFEILEHLLQYHFSVSINTNATLVSKDAAKRIAGYRRIKTLTVSMDGDDAEIMDSMRGRGAFDKAIRGIENIISTGRLRVSLSVTINKINFKRIRELALLGKKLGARSVRYNSVFFIGNAACNSKDLALTPTEHQEVIRLIDEARKEFGNFVTGSYLQELEILGGLRGKESDNLDYIKVDPCGAATKKACITPEGWVTPCDLVWNTRAGNLRERSFLDIWQNSEVMREFRKAITYSLKGHEGCIVCKYKRLCYQGHRCEPYYYENGLKVEDVRCLKV